MTLVFYWMIVDLIRQMFISKSVSKQMDDSSLYLAVLHTISHFDLYSKSFSNINIECSSEMIIDCELNTCLPTSDPPVTPMTIGFAFQFQCFYSPILF